jgi:hypothetical protein
VPRSPSSTDARTVKAHLTGIFAQVGVTDGVQATL